VPTSIVELPPEEDVSLGEDFIEQRDTTSYDAEDAEDALFLDPDSEEFVHELCVRVMVFMEDFCEVELFPYQREVAYRIIQSVLLGDGEEITVLQARQSGKSEVLSNVIVAMMVLLPRLAKAYPELLAKFEKGFWVGVFAPTETQAETVWSRVHDKLTSDKAVELLGHPELEDKASRSGGKAKTVTLRNSGSLCRMQTANPKAKIESKSYHFVLVDEAQECDDYIVQKSISPTLAFYNGTKVFTGTPNRTKNFFFNSIRYNRARQTRARQRQNHFEYDYRTVIKYNPDYKKFVMKERARLGEDSDEFQMSYACKWMLEQGMFVTEDRLDDLCDPGMDLVRRWYRDPIVIGIDPARTTDSTVLTAMWVDWNAPDRFGYFEHRILNWLEIHNKPWEEQYAMMYDFISSYRVMRIGVDAQGMGSAVAERIQAMFPDVDVVPCTSDSKNQSERWKHLLALIERRMLVYPGSSRAKRTRVWKRFHQQMVDLEKKFQGPYMLAAAPDIRGMHDDYPDSAALAAIMTIDDIVEEVEVMSSPFVKARR
jgi:hypothetical protein